MISAVLCLAMVTSMLAGCGSSSTAETSAAGEESAASEAAVESEATEASATEEATQDFSGEELSIIVSQDWMNDCWDEVIENFEETYDVTVDLQTIPADQYDNTLQTKLTTDSCPDIFWIQSNPFAISSVIVDPEKYCIDMTGEEWESIIPEARLSSCEYDGKLYGLQLWTNSPEYVLVYNKTLFGELGLEAPTTYEELKSACETIAAEGITPWFIAGSEGWVQALAFFQIGGVYEEADPGLYDALNNNTATFADNEKMLEVLNQFKELSDAGYFGEDWIGATNANLDNDFAERKIAMAMANPGEISAIEEAGATDEFDICLIPLGDNDTYPTNPAGPTMFGYNGSEHPELVKEFFRFVTTTESLQSILDNHTNWTNIAVNDENVEQHWLPQEEALISSIDSSKQLTAVLQTGTKYTNDSWGDFCEDMIAFCQGTIDANTVLQNMDSNRAESAKVAGDENWN
jgi:raffinose/stachyose/melibiose transport system substrate-binding protein